MNLEHSVRLKKGVRRRDDEEEGKWPDKTRQIINNYFIDPSFVARLPTEAPDANTIRDFLHR